jgi:hypothetical protein
VLIVHHIDHTYDRTEYSSEVIGYLENIRQQKEGVTLKVFIFYRLPDGTTNA